MANDKSLSQRDLNILIDLARGVMWAGPEIHRELQKRRVFITPARFYADIPSVDEVEAFFEHGEPDGPYSDPALFDIDAVLARRPSVTTPNADADRKRFRARTLYLER